MLEVVDLEKHYSVDKEGRSAGVKGVSFTVAEGEFFTLLGPSGSGKTTTLRCIAGLESPDGGTIRLAGETIYDGAQRVNRPAYQRPIGLVFQSYAIWPHMTVVENVAFPLSVAGIPKADRRTKALEMLDMVGLAHVASRPATLLSGGQQQRVALARALVREAPVVLFDEPLSNLDAALRVEMRRELRALQRRLNATALYVTHDQEEAMSLSDRLAVMADGAIVEVGSPSELYMEPREVFTAGFLGRGAMLEGQVVSDAERGMVCVETTAGRLTVRPCRQDPSRKEVKVLVRPEAITLEALTAVGDGCLPGRIESRSFLGDAVEYVVEAGDAQLLVREHAESAWDSGDSVSVRIRPSGCVVL